MTIARKCALPTLISLCAAFYCVVPSAAGQIAWIADDGNLYTVDLRSNPPARSQLIPNARAYKVVVAPGGAKAWTVDSTELLQAIDGVQVRQLNLPVWRGGGGIAITPDAARAYLPVGNGVTPVDLVTPGPNWAMPAIPGFTTPWDIVITPDGKRAYVSDPGANKVVELDITRYQDNVRRTFVVSGPRALAITPDAKKLYAAGSGSPPTVTPIDLTTGTVSAAIVFADAAAGSIAGQLAVDPAGRTLYVGGDNHLLVLSTANNHEDSPIPLNLAGSPLPTVTAVTMSPDGTIVYAAAGSSIVPVSTQNEEAGVPFAGFTKVTSIAFPLSPYRGYDAKVYFVGDSVTAGFGYCGSADVGIILGCSMNAEFTDSWWNANQNSLGYCAPRKVPDDRCSNNNYNPPWSGPNGGLWSQGDNAPTIAYSYVIARDQAAAPSRAEVRNWAITGSEPTHWDPGGLSEDGVMQQAGIFGPQLQNIHNSYVVMTLGANPLLGDYLHVYTIPGLGLLQLTTKDFDCASTTQPNGEAAPLTTVEGGVGACLLQQWGAEQQADHLFNVYDMLLRNDNRVLVVGYPYVCPWSFGTWQSTANLVLGPSSGNRCDQQLTQPGGVSQEDQAFYLADTANALIKSVVTSLRNPNITFLAPSAEGKVHQHYGPEGPSWVFGNDTWIHPSAEGHRDLASRVEAQMCLLYQHWCGNGNGTVAW